MWFGEEDSDQPGHQISLRSVFAVRTKKYCVVSPRWTHTHFVGFVMTVNPEFNFIYIMDSFSG